MEANLANIEESLPELPPTSRIDSIEGSPKRRRRTSIERYRDNAALAYPDILSGFVEDKSDELAEQVRRGYRQDLAELLRTLDRTLGSGGDANQRGLITLCVGVAEGIKNTFYRHLITKDRLVWPSDFLPQTGGMNAIEKKACSHLLRCLYQALCNHWISLLSPLQFKVLVFVLGRTWQWRKPRECVSLDTFMGGFFVEEGTRCLQAGIAGSNTNLVRAIRHLVANNMLVKGYARMRGTGTRITWYELNVYRILSVSEIMEGDLEDFDVTLAEELLPQ